MKEINFRFVFKHKENGNVHFFKASIKNGEMVTTYDYMIYYHYNKNWELIAQDLFLFQDKNGNDVYENDIVKYKDKEHTIDSKMQETSETMTECCGCYDYSTYTYGWHIGEVGIDLCVKIGNKYEQKTNE
jgi:hypothetical protein